MSFHSEIIGMIWFRRNSSQGNHFRRLRCIKKAELPTPTPAELTPASQWSRVMAADGVWSGSSPGIAFSRRERPLSGYRRPSKDVLQRLAPCLHLGQFRWFSSRVPEFPTGLAGASVAAESYRAQLPRPASLQADLHFRVCFSRHPTSEP